MQKNKRGTEIEAQYISPIYDDREELIQRLKWMNKIRNLVAAGLFLLTAGLYLYFYFYEPEEKIIFFFQKRLLIWTLIVEFIEAFINTPYSFLIKRFKNIELFGTVQATLDMLLITAFTYLFGGIDFPVSIVIFAFGIALIGFIFYKGMAYWLAFVSSAGYSFIVFGQYFNWIPVIRTFQWELDIFEQTVLVIFNITAFFLMANFSGDVVDMLKNKIRSLRHVLEERDKLHILQKKLLADLHEAQAISHIGNWELDLNTRTAILSKEVAKIYGITSKSELVPMEEFIKHVHPDYVSLVTAEVDMFLEGKKQPDVQFQIIRDDGEIRWVHWIGKSEPKESNNKIRMVGTVQDISDQKKSEEALSTSLREKEVLLKEIHHRVKNNLQIISSLLYLQSRNIEDEKTASLFTDSRNRITSMALIHENLYRSDDLANISIKEYIYTLTTEIVSSYKQEGRTANLQLDIDSVPLSIDKAIPCGLIINELVSNIMKYAFPNDAVSPEDNSSETGFMQIHVSLKQTNAKQIQLIVSDNGKGFPENIDFRETTSLGLQLVNSLVDQLDGEINLKKENGTKFEILFS
ncbi:MAG: histidine kinase dimerization/phosphoacceptor domain -containing protein [Thermodesulfobacteriota bacterium]|nr:histidine kinase dimerization/phosphoacceptor domain -containing protein [Thermodesulfobacteriota bacterium]